MLLFVSTCTLDSGTRHRSFYQKEDTYDLTLHRVFCPPGCGTYAREQQNIGFASGLRGGRDSNNQMLYHDESPICVAAVHAGLIGDAGGYISMQVLEGIGPNADSAR